MECFLPRLCTFLGRKRCSYRQPRDGLPAPSIACHSCLKFTASNNSYGPSVANYEKIEH